MVVWVTLFAEVLGGMIDPVTSRRKKREQERDPLEAYRRIRKPMPPPQKVVPDRRRELEEEQAQRDVEEER
jgi:hypothetical protein